MIRINLLPHREAKRKQKQSAFVALMALGGLVGAGIVLLVGGYNASQISVQNERNEVLKQASAELDKKIGEITTLKEEIAALQARQQAVEDRHLGGVDGIVFVAIAVAETVQDNQYQRFGRGSHGSRSLCCSGKTRSLRHRRRARASDGFHCTDNNSPRTVQR